MNRRHFLLSSLVAIGSFSLPLSGCRFFRTSKNILSLPVGFSARVVSVSGEPPIPGASFDWHALPDGGATFSTGDGWVYVSNGEVKGGGGSVSALSFDREGNIIDAYGILRDTTRNCNGGTTPWGSWLSCEEIPSGLVWETDPLGVEDARVLPALGRFRHESVAFDLERNILYLTEDYKDDGRLYRYLPNGFDDRGRVNLHDGTLQVARLHSNKLSWLTIEDPLGSDTQVRFQQPKSTQFKGIEGIVYHDSCIYFTTRNSGEVWMYDIQKNEVSVLYSPSNKNQAILSGVDDITVMPNGQLLVAEDRGNMQIVVVDSAGKATPIIKVVGHKGSEVTGLAFSPDYKRLYFSSQRGAQGSGQRGVTFEVSGPFNDPDWVVMPYEVTVEI